MRPGAAGLAPLGALTLVALMTLPALLGGGSPAFGLPAGWYRSDAIGLALEPLPSTRRGEPYLLQVEQRGELEVRTLYQEGKAVRRWELSPGLERVYEGDSLAEERSYDPGGRLLVEKLYSGGRVERTQYRYGASGLSSVESFGPDGELRSRERYELGPKGELRRVRRETGAGTGRGAGQDGQEAQPAQAQSAQTEELALVAGDGRLYEERLRGGGRGLISRYDLEGRVSSQETWREGELLESLDTTWAGRTPVASELSADGRRTVTRFDAQGRETSRRVTGGGKTLEDWTFRYDGAGRRVQAVLVDEHGTEQWSYFYDGAGALAREEYRARGQLARVVRYEEDGRVEELYRAGLPFLLVTWRGGVKVLEEFLEGGQVVRRRQFGETP
jgi:YD repeat-containing protein